jgi:antitoxin YefM
MVAVLVDADNIRGRASGKQAGARPRPSRCEVARRLVKKYIFLYVTREADMRTVNFTQLRQNLAAELDSVTDDAEELVVTRSGHEPVVIVPLAEYASMKETEYLLRSPGNAQAMRRSIAELDRGEGVERALIDPAAAQDVDVA